MILSRMLQYITPLMMIMVLAPQEALGDIIGGHRDGSSYEKAQQTGLDGSQKWTKPRLLKLGSRPPSSIKNSVPSKPISSVSHAHGLTSGWVEMNAKIDMRAIAELLNEIPEILHLLKNVTGKVDTFDAELILNRIKPLIAGLKDEVGSGFNKVNKILHDLIQGLHDGSLDSTERKVSQILEYLETLEENSQKPVHCKFAELERGFESFVKSIEDPINRTLRQISTDMAKGEAGLSGIRQNNNLLLQILSILQGLSGKSSKGMAGGECNVCQKLEHINVKEKEKLNTINSMGQAIQNIPREIGMMFKGDGGLGGLRKEIQTIIKIDEGMKGKVEQLNELLEALSLKTERYFHQHQKIIIETQYTMRETAKTIQRSATSTEQVVKKMVQEAARAARMAERNCS